MTELSPDSMKPKARRTLWHRLLGKEFELLLTPVDIEVVTEVQVSSIPPLADILLLRRHTAQWTPAQLQFLPDGIRDSQASHCLIEFKFRETFGEDVVRQAIGYDYFYQQGQQLQDVELATFVLCAQTPQADTLAAAGFQATPQPGVYRHLAIAVRRVILLVINELAPALHNAFVQCFATNRRVRTAAFRQIKQADEQLLHEELWEFLFGLQEQWRQRGGEMSNLTTDELLLDEGLTPEELIESGREWRALFLARMTPQERLAGVSGADIIQLLEEDEEIRKQIIDDEQIRRQIIDDEQIRRQIIDDEQIRRQIIAQVPPAERLEGLTMEELATLLEQIERHLGQHKP